MKKSEIKVGQLYRAKVSGHLTTVRVEKIRVQEYGKRLTRFEVVNLTTGRRVTFRSAAKFQEAAKIKLGDKLPTGITDGDGKEVISEYSPLHDALAKAVLGNDEPEIPANGKPVPTPLSALLSKSIERTKQPVIKPTEEQAAIIQAAKHADKSLVIEAGAGAGKTSTLKMLEQVLPGRGQYTAFNTSLVAESKSKFQKAQCNTTHSLAFRAVGKDYQHRLGGNRVRSDEVASRLGIGGMTLTTPNLTGTGPGTVSKPLSPSFLAGQVMVAVKRFCQSADREIGGTHFRYLDGLDAPVDGQRSYVNNEQVKEYLQPFAEKAWKDLSDPNGSLPFSHDCYVKAWQLGEPKIGADYILLDEAQDSAPVFLDVLKQQKSSLVILVGDSCQSIYEWRGAVNALDAFPDAPRLWLTQSFRFGPLIADVANSVLASMQDPVKLRLRGTPSIESKVIKQAGDSVEVRCVLCRTNAAAVSTVLNAFNAGQRPHLIGGGSEVVAFVKGAQALQDGRPTGHPDLACFSTWHEVVEYSKLDEGEELRLLCKLIKEFGCQPIIRVLENMPKEEHADLVVCTAHKSKGREWESVRLTGDFPCNDKQAGDDKPGRTADDSDRRLVYVAATRAKNLLDISACPFFTGESGLEIVTNERRDEASPTALPPTPAQRPTVTEFTWAKSRDGRWLVRGPKGANGEVEVTRKNGSRSRETIIKIALDFPEACLYEIS